MAEKKNMSDEDKKKKKGVSYDDSEDEGDSSGLLKSLSLMKLNPRAGATTLRKKLLVLSIGGLLCHRVNRKDISAAPIYNRSPDAVYGSYRVYKRPYCTEFMKFCLERFEVGIWSSAREWYMNSALDCIMVGLRSKLLFAWDQNECTNSGFMSLEKKTKPIFLKELKKIWENKYLPMSVKQYSSSNTLLVDTDAYKALLNPAHTAVFPTDYKTSIMNDTALGPRGELRVYLDGLADADDVTTYVKENPFGQAAITPIHPDWDYYSKIITSFSKN